MSTIGLCEDQEPIRGALARGLRHADHEVVAAHTGGEALKLFGADQAIASSSWTSAFQTRTDATSYRR